MTVALPKGRRVEIDTETGLVEVFCPISSSDPADNVSFAIGEKDGVFTAEARRKGLPWTSWTTCSLDLHVEEYCNSVSVSAQGPHGFCPILAHAALQPE